MSEIYDELSKMLKAYSCSIHDIVCAIENFGDYQRVLKYHSSEESVMDFLYNMNGETHVVVWVIGGQFDYQICPDSGMYEWRYIEAHTPPQECAK